MRVPDEESLRVLYSDLDEGKLLEIATKKDDLTNAAQEILRRELNKRGISDLKVSEFAQYLKSIEAAQRAAPIATRINGCGTALFDRRDERPDGSFLVTRWVTVFWIPVFPLGEMRIRQVILADGRRGYIILEELPRPRRRP